jgi:hypothetical protein
VPPWRLRKRTRTTRVSLQTRTQLNAATTLKSPHGREPRCGGQTLESAAKGTERERERRVRGTSASTGSDWNLYEQQQGSVEVLPVAARKRRGS